MTGIVSTVRVTPLMSPRTVKYVGAMIREGDNFDYHQWLKMVRDEEAQATRVSATSASGEAAPVQIKSPIRTSTGLNTSSPRAVIKAVPVPRAIWRLHHKAISNGPTWWLKKSLLRGTSFRPVALETRYMGIWRRCSPSWIITEHGDGPTNSCGTHLYLRIGL
jgi:hypothetical protein